MTFTDSDLKRLKNKPHNPHEDRAQITHYDLMTLLARLEAAEEDAKRLTGLVKQADESLRAADALAKSVRLYQYIEDDLKLTADYSEQKRLRKALAAYERTRPERSEDAKARGR